MTDPLAQEAAEILRDCSAEFKRIINDINQEYKKKFYKEAESAISIWYNSFQPRFYNRKEDLYNIYDIEVIGYNAYFRMGPEYMKKKHHQSNEYIYESSVVRGYHGGSIGEDRHGEVVDIPYYRAPLGRWTHWSNPSPQSSIALEEYLSDLDEEIYQATKEKYKKQWIQVANRWNAAFHYLFG